MKIEQIIRNLRVAMTDARQNESHFESWMILNEAICDAIDALAEQDSTCSNSLRAQGKAYPRTCKKCGLGPCVGLAQQALDKKAKNARELGLDYEPVCNKDPQGCWNVRCQLGKKCKNTPAQRTWVGLTDEEITDMWAESSPYYHEDDFARAIEAKLKENNT